MRGPWSCIFRNWSRLSFNMYIFLTLEFNLLEKISELLWAWPRVLNKIFPVYFCTKWFLANLPCTHRRTCPWDHQTSGRCYLVSWVSPSVLWYHYSNPRNLQFHWTTPSQPQSAWLSRDASTSIRWQPTEEECCTTVCLPVVVLSSILVQLFAVCPSGSEDAVWVHILRCGVQKSILDHALSREWEYHLGKVLLKKMKSLQVEYVYRCT